MFVHTFRNKTSNLDLTIKKKPLKTKNFINSFSLIYGVNQKRILPLISLLGIQTQTKIKDLTDTHIQKIKFFFEHNDSLYILSDLYREKYLAIKKLILLKCYKGNRHQKRLPVRGQRTHSNSKTAKRPYFFITDIQPIKSTPKIKKQLKKKKQPQLKLKSKQKIKKKT